MNYQFKKILLKDFFNIYYKNIENKDAFDRINMFDSLIDENIILFSLFDENKIIAISAISVNNNLAFSELVSVDKEYSNKGLAKFLIEERAKWLSENHLSLIINKYSKDGEKYLKHINDLFSKKYNITIIEKSN